MIKWTDGYELVTDPRRFVELLHEVRATGNVAALDFETTGLDEATSRVRLAQIRNDHVWFVADFFEMDRAIGSFSVLFEKDTEWVAFNAGFEYKFLHHAGAREARVTDVAHLRRAMMGGDQMSFAQMLKVDLKVDISKAEQASNWGAPVLTDEQLDYAADDAWYTWELRKYWLAKLPSPAYPRRLEAAAMFDDLVQPVHGMQSAGLLLDRKRHAKLVHIWEEKRDSYERVIRKHIPKAAPKDGGILNLSSRAQWSDLLGSHLPDDWFKIWPRTGASGQLQIKVETCKQNAQRATDVGFHDLSETLYALADRMTVQQYLSNFGDKLIGMAERSATGRIYPSYNIARAVTCRFSSSNPNAQQLPRDRELLGEWTSVRQSFLASYGRLLVSLDYSGIELRVLALLSEDQQLLEDVVYGNVHAETGALIAGRTLDLSVKADKEIRSQAKGVNFGIIYGAGASGIAVSLRSTTAFASEVLGRWQDRYPKAFAYRERMMEEARATGYIPMIDGGTIHMSRNPELPKCANYPVQRGALSIMAEAIIDHHDSVQRMGHGSRMLATIHDALISETRAAHAPELLQVMAKDMTEGFLRVFPGASTHRLLEGGIGPNWGQLEELEIAA